MTDFQQQYDLWDEFLTVWPVSRLETMTLDEYTQVGSKDSFTYWIESRLDKMGSIWGGSSFKFGIYSRKNTESKMSGAGLSYSGNYGWYSSFGATADEAFKKIRYCVLHVAKLATRGDLDAIEAFEQLGVAFKWKIAFQYQNRQSPSIVAIFKPVMLAAFVGEAANKSMADLQRAALAIKPADLDIIEFSEEIWTEWGKKNMEIWKLSHGREDFSEEERLQYFQSNICVIHRETAKSQGKHFQETPIGTLFYLCHGNEKLLLVGQFISEPEGCEKGDGWLQRHYRVLKTAIKEGAYKGPQKAWTPNYNSTFRLVSEPDLPLFETALLKPHFGIDLTELSVLAGKEEQHLPDKHEPVVWIEKTIVQGRQDRADGEHALGKALWSPQRSKDGADIYANMRAVKPGDIILHLTDNKGFTGVSVAAEDVDNTFGGITGTEWYRDCYRIALSDYVQLTPALLRDELLQTEPYATELKELIESGVKGLFYNTKLELNQGAYLTKATPTLVSILSRAYFEAAGKPLPLIGKDGEFELDKSVALESYSIEDALEILFLDRQEIEEVLLVWRAKKNIVLQGPPGVGKSFAAEKLAFALMEEADRERVGFVQFHQSYSYEDFVEGFRPTDKGFELKVGKFVQFCRRAEADPNNQYVFVIDEINRGNLSKILGELMLLIEGDKRGPNWAISLASGKVAFHVPPNVYVMGLMNTADRSLAVVDYALRRRFAFIDLMPKIHSPKFVTHMTENGVGQAVAMILVERVLALNDEIVKDTLNLGPGFAIGHSFFCSKPLPSETDRSWYKRVVKTEIAPLLREYWFDTPQRALDWEARLLEGQ